MVRELEYGMIRRETMPNDGIHYPLILASQSIGRRILIEGLKIPYLVFPVDINEEQIKKSLMTEDPSQLALTLAREKNVAARKQLKKKNISYDLLLTADTIIIDDEGNIFGKPKNETEAFEMLKILQGKTHHVISACVLWNVTTRKQVEKIGRALVTMRKVENDILRWYVNGGEPLGKAGGYAIQGTGSFLIEKIEGSLAAVIGLPFEDILTEIYQVIMSK